MSVLAHLNALSAKHAQLKDQIHSAYSHHLSDADITELKKQKLLIKEELVDIQRKYPLEELAA